MKKIYYYSVFCIILVCLYFLISCAPSLEEKNDGLTVRFETGEYEDGVDYFAQVYLLIDRELFPLGEDTDYVEQAIITDPPEDQTSITVEQIPAGRYILWLGVGKKREENGAFDVQYYYESEEFDLIAGSTTTLTATLLPCPFNKALNVLGEDINAAVIDTAGLPAHLYASGPDNLYYDDGNYTQDDPDFQVDPYETQTFPDYDINSISKGLDFNGGGGILDCLYVSTTVGISLWNGNPGSTLVDDFSSGSDRLGEVNVLKSLAYPDGSNVSLFFQRNGGLGGVYWNSDPPEDWVNVDYSEILKDQLVWDFFVTDDLGSYNGGYFATALGALRVPQAVIDNYDEGNEVRLMSQVDFFEVTDDNGDEIPIVALGYDIYGNDVYMGTMEGLYWAGIGTTQPLDNTPQLLEETEGTRIYIVLINNDYRAYASLTYLFIQEKATDDVISLPFVAGMPGEIATMDWDGNVLVIAGTLGLVALDVDTLF